MAREIIIIRNSNNGFYNRQHDMWYNNDRRPPSTTIGVFRSQMSSQMSSFANGDRIYARDILMPQPPTILPDIIIRRIPL